MDAKQVAELWEPLADKIGRPEGNHSRWLVWWCGQWRWSDHPSPLEHDIGALADAVMAAALWRDHATEYAERHGYTVRHVSGQWVPLALTECGAIAVRGWTRGMSRDHALAAACRAVAGTDAEREG